MVRSLPRQGLVVWERDPHPDITVDDILEGKTGVGLGLDFEVLEAALRYNYLTALQFRGLGSREEPIDPTTPAFWRRVRRRFQRLHEVGLLDRAWVRYRPKTVDSTAVAGVPLAGEWAYAVSVKGMELLVRTNSPWARRWESDWRPRSAGESRKLSIAHELGRNDVAVAMWAEARTLGHPLIEWEGPREAYHRVAPPTPGAPWQHVEPDSVLILHTGRPLLLEYERSGRADKFLAKVRAMRMYLASGAWKERHPSTPWIVYAVPSFVRTESRESGSFGALAAQAKTLHSSRYLFVNDEQLRQGNWDAVDSDGRRVPFWPTVWNTAV